MKVVHKHLIIRAEVKRPIIDPGVAKDWLRRLIAAIGMKITKNGGPHCDYVKKENNEGIAAVAIIETSHVALHIWDKNNPPLAQIDVYSCSEFDPNVVAQYLKVMEPINVGYKFLDREHLIEEITNGLVEVKQTT